ncbi:MAG TPA: polyhydroxyalkanoic acid system family protein [Variovorax sp.]|nr:polyhydroxyalkanoic acid system family protein [Variovorax sp.]
MPEIHIERSHALGMQKARKVAAQWAERVEKAHGVHCTHTQGRGEDIIQISRTGVHGTAKVTGKSFELEMKLGFLFGLFSQRISEGVARELDALLGEAQAPAKPAAAKKPRVIKTATPVRAKAAAKAPAAKRKKA